MLRKEGMIRRWRVGEESTMTPESQEKSGEIGVNKMEKVSKYQWWQNAVASVKENQD